MASKRRVVVVGGGASGARLARVLSGQLTSANHEITLVSAHPYFVHLVASLRMLVTDEDSLENQMLITYDKLFVNGNGTFRQGRVTGIEAEKGLKKGGKVILESGEKLDYDVLVLSPGSTFESFLNFPSSDKEMKEHIREWRNRFAGAKNIVIAGGGPVGLELSGELKHFYPMAKVTVVHDGKKLLNGAFPDKYRDDVEQRLRSIGVKIILDDSIDTFPTAATRKGVKLDEADLVVSARGPRPNTSWIASSLGDEVLNEEGRVRIRPTMQLDAYPNIFAIGDVTDFPEQKQTWRYFKHVSTVAPNVKNVLDGIQPKSEYKAQPDVIMLTMGKNNGVSFVGFLWGLIFGNWFTSTLKGKELVISRTRKDLGHPK